MQVGYGAPLERLKSDRPERYLAMIHLPDYPNIRRIFWSMPDVQDLDEETVYSALDNGWKWIDLRLLTERERALVDRLAIERGHGWIGNHHVHA